MKKKETELKDVKISATEALRAIYKILNADTFPKKKFIKSILLSALNGAVASFRPKIWGLGINSATGLNGLANPEVAIYGGMAYMMDIFNGYMNSQKYKSETELGREIFINFEAYCRTKYIGEDKSFRNDNPLPAFNQAKNRARQSVQGIARDLTNLTNSTSQTITSGAILGTISPLILAGVVLYSSTNIAWNFWHENKMRPLRKKFNKNNDDIYSRMGDITGNTDIIQRTGNEEEYSEILKNETGKLKRYWARISELERKKSVKSMLVNTFFNAAVFGTAYRVLKKQHSKIGDLVTLIDSVSRFSSATTNLGNTFTSIKRNLTEYRDAMEILNHIPLIKDKENAIDLPLDKFGNKIPDIEFNNVNHSYKDGEKEVLKDFNLKIPGGQKIAILGDSGAGKTSLMSLLLREYELTSGKIKIGEYNNDDIKLRSLRKFVRYIPQNSGFLDRSFRENLTLVKPDASDTEIEFALSKAKLLDLVNSRPEKLETKVGHNANTLSGGEQQRLALARAFLAPSPIVIMDEPEKGLDPKLRSEVLANIKDFADYGNGRTMIVITHDPFIAQGMDRIIVLENGKIVEDGHPKDLVKDENGKYFSAINSFSSNER